MFFLIGLSSYFFYIALISNYLQHLAHELLRRDGSKTYISLQQLKFTVTPIPAKRLELLQSLESLMILFRPYFDELTISESKRMIIIEGRARDMGQLKEIIDSREFEVLSGALSMLALKTNLNIKGDADIVRYGHSIKSSVPDQA